MTPLVTFPDPILAALGVLRTRLPALFEALGVTVGTVDPGLLGGDFTGPPYVMVRLDATLTRYPVTETATLRVTTWGGTEAKGLRLAQLARAVLLAHPGDLQVRSFGALTGPIPATDPDDGQPLSYFTVAARLRPTTL